MRENIYRLRKDPCLSDDVKINLKGLEKMIKALKKKPVIARVGVLGNHNQRDDGESNASIGAKHEFGTSSLPVRSFLRLPISALLFKYMEDSGAFNKESLAEVVKQASFRPWVEKVAILAENIVQDAFDSGGFGIWPKSNMANKTNHQTLVETQQLRNSITSEVIGD